MVSLAEQLSAFGLTILGGVGMGFVFDVFRILRHAVGPRRPVALLLDVIYWILVTPSMIALLWRANNGDLRFYVVLGVLIGSLLYNVLISAVVLRWLSALWQLIGTVLGWIVHVLVVVVTWPVLVVRNLLYMLPRPAPAMRRRGGAARRGKFAFPWRPVMAWRRR